MDWKVLLIGGSSGVGKTAVAPVIARHFGVPWVQVDDVRLALQRVTSPAEHPALHFFLATEGVWDLPAEELCEALIVVARVMSEAIESVIDHHVLLGPPLVVEGDGILPETAGRRGRDTGGQVRSVFLHEPDEEVLLTSLRARNRGHFQTAPLELQRRLTRQSWLFGEWLRREAEAHGVPVVAVRPWDTLVERVLAAVEGRKPRMDENS